MQNEPIEMTTSAARNHSIRRSIRRLRYVWSGRLMLVRVPLQ
jgi:hypothetical protein